MEAGIATLGLNEANVRDVNEEIDRVAKRLGSVGGDAFDLTILCECGRRGCRELLSLTAAQYAALRRRATRFAVMRGHEEPVVERVVQERDSYLLVEKFGLAGAVAREMHQRAHHD